MKKIILMLSCCLLMTSFAIAQKTDTSYTSPQPLYDSYLKKANTNKTAAWATLGTGIGMVGLGSYIYIVQAVGEGDIGGAGPALFYLGAASTLVSIPLFIGAGQNKRKANLSLKKESVFIDHKVIDKSTYTALAFNIRL